MEAQIILRPGNPLDITSDDLEDLAQLLRGLDEGYDVQVTTKEQRGYGVTWWEVILIWFLARGSAVLDAEVEAMMRLAIDWARKRFFRSPGRPKYIAIYGPDNKVLKSVLVKTESEEVENLTMEDRKREEDFPHTPTASD